jgi:lipopolysaccharide/colanic/teichoic acid biosynthesis glycosyltransferase
MLQLQRAVLAIVSVLMTLHVTSLAQDAEQDGTVVLPSATDGRYASTSKRSVYRSVFKRLIDVTLITVALILVLPIMLVMILLVATDGNNPFYSQKRVGRNGHIFRMWKLRTMVPGADEMLKKYLASNPDAKAEWDATQKLKKDPRITPVGRILRKTSLDELPQLWNVLNGDMSLVGPRPMMLSQRSLYHGQGYYRLRPGITGLWQISDRNNCEFTGRVRYDDVYDREISFGMDVSILMKTVGVVLRGTGY